MEEFVRSMTYPFLACLVLAGIHVYLGLHVVERKVIFVDLALAQIAALGSVYGVLLGYDLHDDPWAVKGFSLAFALAGAAVFSITRERRERIPHEAVIGITYAFAVAATILVSTRLSHGTEEMHELFTGSILWVRGDTLLYVALLYAGVGALHYALRHKFLLITLDPGAAERNGINVRRWDFLFYVLFGVVVTNAVAIAGVLLVFAYLVIPAAIAVLFADSVKARLMIGWAVGAVVSFIGVIVSYTNDLPSGPVIVVSLAMFLALSATVDAILRSPHKGKQVMRVAATAAVIVLAVASSLSLRKTEEVGALELLGSPAANDRLVALRAAGDDAAFWQHIRPRAAVLLNDPEPQVRVRMVELVGIHRQRDLIEAVHPLLLDADEAVREAGVDCVRRIGTTASIEPILAAASREQDEFLKLEMAAAVLELGDSRGLTLLADLETNGRLAQVRKEAGQLRADHADSD